MSNPSAYQRAGVDIAAGQQATDLLKGVVRATFGPEVLSDVGSFGGLFDLSRIKEMSRPILVASTDGVGTKTMVAARMGRWHTVGQDLFNHCLNDILVQGATPLFFLDYVASSRLNPEQVATVVGGIARACRAAGCALLGGETAEMPGVYHPGELDLVGTIVGVVDRADLIDGRAIAAGDVVLGLPSNGLHTNGYSLARAVLSNQEWRGPRADLGTSIGEALLAVHRSYLAPVQAWRGAGVPLHGLAHVTGGGLVDNPPRILPEGLGLVLRPEAWQVPPIFDLIRRLGDVSTAEMRHVFNMGLGLLAVVPAAAVPQALAAVSEAVVVGEVVAGTGVTFV